MSAEGDPLFDHLLVDDLQDTTLAAEAILVGLRSPDLVAAADPDAHLFSFQGMSRIPLDRFAERFPGTDTVTLAQNHRSAGAPVIEAWISPHASEEHAAVARELRRLHVEEGVAWADLAVVVRRQGSHLGGLLRALDDARIPRAVPERGLSLTAEPATRPYVLALRWLVADEPRRDELIEQLLTSDVVGLSPATARGLMRTASAATGSRTNALDVTEGLSPDEIAQVEAAREALATASLFAGMSVQDAFKQLWESLPCSRRLVERSDRDAETRRELDTVVTFANVVSEADDGNDKSVAGFLESLDAGEHGPGHSAWERSQHDAVHVLTAHGTVGREFEAIIVTGVTEGNFPSVHRAEPMFDLAVLDRVVTNAERNRERLQDERRLFDAVLARARRRVVLLCADAHPGRGRAHRALALRARAGDRVGTRARGSVRGTGLRSRGRRHVAPPSSPNPTSRPGAGSPRWRGSWAWASIPSRWWFQREWTDPGRPLHDEIRVSYSRLSNLEACELMHVLGDELGLGRPGGYHAWVGKTVHKLIEDVERGEVEKDPRAMVEALELRWRPQEFPSLAVSEAFRNLARDHMLRNWFETYGDTPALGIEQFFEFAFEGVTVIGYIDRIGPSVKDGTTITDFKTGKSDNAGPPKDSLQLGIYYLAVQESEALAQFKPVRTVELAFLRGNWKRPDIDFRKMPINPREEEQYQADMRERLAGLIQRKKDLNASEVYRPNPYANCRFCDFKSLCPLYAEGQPVFPLESLRRAPEGAAS